MTNKEKSLKADQQSGATSAKPKKEKNQVFFAFAVAVVSIICVPYLYYAIRLNAYGHANKPEGV